MHLLLPFALGLGLLSAASLPMRAAVTQIYPPTSSCFVFSPANWATHSLQDGVKARQSWNAGAYFRVTFKTETPAVTIALHLGVKQYGTWNGTNWSLLNPIPAISYSLDGLITDDVPADGPTHDGILSISVPTPGSHTLTVWLRNSEQLHRWVRGGTGSNVLQVNGISFGEGAVPLAGKRQSHWVLIVGDSITEGIQADNGRDNVLYDYSWLDAQALFARGYETAISACGYSGWVCTGCADGDVPGYYVVNKGSGGKWVYDDGASRWNKIDGVTSLLDSQGRMSGYGGRNQPPSVIFFNYGTNETLSRAVTARMAASIEQCLPALRKAAPNAEILVAVPFGIESTRVYGSEGLLYAAALRRAVRNYLKQHPDDRRTHLVDLGANVANALASPIYGAGIHPNMAGHAFLAPLVLQVIEQFLPTK